MTLLQHEFHMRRQTTTLRTWQAKEAAPRSIASQVDPIAKATLEQNSEPATHLT